MKVLDALIAWSVARPGLLAFKVEEGRDAVVSFERAGTKAGTKVVFWSAQVTRGEGPRLKIYPPAGRSLSAADRAAVLQTLNAHARPALLDGDRLRIGFGALKNDTARAAVLTLLTQLLSASDQPASPAEAALPA